MRKIFDYCIYPILVSIITTFMILLSICNCLAIPVFIVFLTVKLLGVITWGWLYVCMPLIIMAGTIFLEILIACFMSALEVEK